MSHKLPDRLINKTLPSAVMSKFSLLFLPYIYKKELPLHSSSKPLDGAYPHGVEDKRSHQQAIEAGTEVLAALGRRDDHAVSGCRGCGLSSRAVGSAVGSARRGGGTAGALRLHRGGDGGCGVDPSGGVEPSGGVDPSSGVGRVVT